ncbi:RagB/SusD family nutrient uptake outer membrane protein [Chitinophaga cymbidii]|uniref:Glycan metabolism protein RagB n=1 Tax=Chitinophaga cymbidii TaxID=1096750 RepID=A0A512RLF3_9BACT|nr:RagB/SusD family nutrient uptake outer membrane protein [Chitinophaga cymbidii]GEP96509.1 hypothetical protein CCY01nite_27690 [Chitinophaga cymbidii]
MQKYILLLTASLMVIYSTSCKKFIEEDLVSTLTYDHYNTDQGLEDLVRSAYTPVKWKFENEQAYTLWNFGVDEFILGDQFNHSYLNTYDAGLNSSTGFLNGMWTNNYSGINRCNLGLERISAYSNPASSLLGTQAQKDQRLGELYFLRGLYYFQLVQQFGGVPLVLESSSGVRTDFARASVPAIYEVVISDLRNASRLLAPNEAAEGRATKGAADHFLAKAYLTRGSAVTDVRGQKATDMDSAAYFAEQVINGGVFVLESDYRNLWNGAYVKGYPRPTVTPIGSDGQPPYNFNGASSIPSGEIGNIQAANNSKEVIFAAQFSDNQNLAGTGNRVHEYFLMQYDAGIPGLVRSADNWNGRPYRRMSPSAYTLDLFDYRNDSRFYKSFRMAYYSNTIPANRALFTASDAPDPSLVGKPKVALGDTAALFVMNTPATALTTVQRAQYRYMVFARYYRDADNALLEGFNNNKYLSLQKHQDPVRVTSNFNEERGVRNGILARLGETYLIAAEAYGRKGNYVKALEYVNKVRERAAYHDGEPKDPHYWMFDGGAYDDMNSTYANMIATTALFTTNAASEQYPPAVTTTEDRFIHFMLNERTRELCGELYRWEDLVRTETLYDRAKLFNKDATGIAPHHKLRPVPQLQIDLTTVDGQPMNAEQKRAYQNPGYD